MRLGVVAEMAHLLLHWRTRAAADTPDAVDAADAAEASETETSFSEWRERLLSALSTLSAPCASAYSHTNTKRAPSSADGVDKAKGDRCSHCPLVDQFLNTERGKALVEWLDAHVLLLATANASHLEVCFYEHIVYLIKIEFIIFYSHQDLLTMRDFDVKIRNFVQKSSFLLNIGF